MQPLVLLLLLVQNLLLQQLQLLLGSQHLQLLT